MYSIVQEIENWAGHGSHPAVREPWAGPAGKKQTMNGNKWALRAILVTALALSAHAGVIINANEVEANVVASASGTLNTTGWSPADTTGYSAGIVLSLGIISAVPAGFYTQVGAISPTASGPTALGTGGVFLAASGTGERIILWTTHEVFAPVVYVSGPALNSTSTWNNTSLAGLGLRADTDTSTWGTGATADSLITNVVPTRIPEPHEYAMVAGLGLVGLGVWRRHARR